MRSVWGGLPLSRGTTKTSTGRTQHRQEQEQQHEQIHRLARMFDRMETAPASASTLNPEPDPTNRY